MADKYGIWTKHSTNEGYEIEITRMLDARKRKIRFQNGCEVLGDISAIGKGQIKNPYHTSVYGVGYFGVGEYKAKIEGKLTPEYEVWYNMLQRCYDESKQEKCPTYKGATICEEWLNFQNFAKWYEGNKYNIEGVKFELNKDLLQQGVENKYYSTSTCLFLPHRVNSFLTNKQSDNTSGYVGVGWHKHAKKWQAQIRVFDKGKRKHLGYFTTPEEASQSYQQARAIEAEKAKEYLRSLNYLPEHIIQLIK